MNEVEKLDINVEQFLNELFDKKNHLKNSSVAHFEEKKENLKFDGPNAEVWQFIVLKSLEPEFFTFRPLANHLIDNNYCEVDGNMVKHAVLTGYKIEADLEKLKYSFDEKKNAKEKECNDVFFIANKIVSQSKDEDFNEVKDMLVKANVNVEQVAIMQRSPNTTKSLRI